MPDDDGLVDALVQSSFAVTAVLTKVGTAHDLSLTQLRVLAILRDRRPRMTALADHLGLDRSSLSGLVDRAARRGLVQRAPTGTDRRVVEVFLTPEGHELANRLYAEILAALSPVLERLAPAERRRLQALLERTLGG
ncbi:MarR family winged helix-turn-helix transcriptional regulator [Pseudonocardia endophytica]|uniref:DNA-binding MarR family transcriptional regulator n=1 Tax=Pseudonocardia endophytica TaxID=401976 RepID=A0A4V2PJ85_PSEEN|nr:MarR family transcriptional regulator [Pseudonocardia endophytica]TCK27506.1 DNA-binding MarR family transcriptional regulator [Pseudonocardia endophytica]